MPDKPCGFPHPVFPEDLDGQVTCARCHYGLYALQYNTSEGVTVGWWRHAQAAAPAA